MSAKDCFSFHFDAAASFRDMETRGCTIAPGGIYSEAEHERDNAMIIYVNLLLYRFYGRRVPVWLLLACVKKAYLDLCEINSLMRRIGAGSDWDRYREELRSKDPDGPTVFTADELLGLAESRIRAELSSI